MQNSSHRFTDEEGYIVITDEEGDIHTHPDASSPIVSRARFGDVFLVVGIHDEWYEVQLFSSVHWYLHRSHAQETLTYEVTLPSDVDTRHAIFNAIVDAEHRAYQEVAAAPLVGVGSTSDVIAEDGYMPADDGVLADRYKLEVMHAFGIHLPEVDQIAAEGYERGWYTLEVPPMSATEDIPLHLA
jgi:hypothetical protein